MVDDRKVRSKARSNTLRTALACLGLALGMGGLAYASVPLYDLFCRMTGFDGTPLVGTAAPAQPGEGSVVVRFDTNVAPGIPWRFFAETGQVDARLGKTKTVFFKVTNTADTPSTGIATFNVQPPLAGSHFVKIQCFCFNEQTLQPGESMDFPVVFYVEPELRTDANTRDLSEITLSYTYFASKNAKPVTAASAAGAKQTF